MAGYATLKTVPNRPASLTDYSSLRQGLQAFDGTNTDFVSVFAELVNYFFVQFAKRNRIYFWPFSDFKRPNSACSQR